MARGCGDLSTPVTTLPPVSDANIVAHVGLTDTRPALAETATSTVVAETGAACST